ncbi:MFS transporter [Nocardioides terrisoli]|uniref:MFS transporter n=1 Tax=Nocardioides terrisoli TaxID=3388267 RepID=UPI00287BBE55|nr:MFS transporter [Nocardioides marmorisolisilvae]
MSVPPLDPTTVGPARRWSILVVSFLAQAASAVTAHGPAFLIPALHDRRGLSLAEAGAVAAAPTIGVMVSLIAWGLFVDRHGERLTLLIGLAGTAGFAALAATSRSTPVLGACLFLAGAAAASTNVASGRVVVGWFPPHRRGLAMGIRQMAQPVGVGVAAVTIAVLAEQHGVSTALWVPAAAAALAVLLVAAVVLDPPRASPRQGQAANPYVGNRYLARIHSVSVLLVVPQFLAWTFALVWLTDARGWSAGAAGALVAVAQILGALGRIGVGQISDMVGSRMRPLRWVAVAAAVTMGLLGLTAHLDWSVAVALMVVATVVTVADNGLAFTAVAESAGPFWSGRALGVQNTAQFLAASLVPPLAGLGIAEIGYPAVFALGALFPIIAAPLVPRGDRRTI